MRAVTRTTLTLGDLLEIPIGIVAATGSQEIKFETALEDGTKRVQQFVHPDEARELWTLAPNADGRVAQWPEDFESVTVPQVIDADDTRRGLFVGKKFLQVPDVEVEAARAATKMESVELLEFIDYRKVPTDRLSGSFYLQPDVGFERPMRTLMEAMRRDGSAMVVKYSVRDRQRLGVVRIRRENGHDVFLLNDVVFADQWRAPEEQVLAPAQLAAADERSVEAALSIIESLKGDGASLTDARDDLPEALTVIVERAHDGAYDDPARVLEIAAAYREEGRPTVADELVAWAEARWPELADKREEVEAIIAEGGEGVGEKLAAVVG